MLKRLVLFLIVLILFSAANAQRSSALAAYRTGLSFKQNNNLAEALNAFAKAISFDKKFDSAYVETGNINSVGGKVDIAIDNYKKALELNPKYTAALIGMAKIYRDSRTSPDSVTARKYLDTAIYYFSAAEKLEKNKETYYALAWIYNARQEYDKAIPYAVKSLAIDNTYKPAYGELGHAYNSSKKFAECIEQLKKNLAVSVVDIALLYSGYAYIELKNKNGAMEEYAALLKVNEKMAAGLKRKIDAMPAN